MIKTKEKIILASGSATRKMLLENSGIDFEIFSSDLDEDAIKDAYLSEQGSNIDAFELGIRLASAKALAVSSKHKDAYVIAADQVCLLGDEIFDKPGTLENCVLHLQKLRGKEHSQNCSCVIAHNSKLVWTYSERALLKIKDLSDDEIQAYVNHEQPIYACGSYMLENYGKYLFDYIKGDHDVVLGLPLIKLLGELGSLGLVSF